MPTRKYSEADVLEWAAQYATGLTLEEIASSSGASIGTISVLLRAQGVQMRPNTQRSKPAIVRFSKKYAPEPNTGCWLWTAGTSGRGAFRYGIFHFAGEITAHRVSYILHKGPIPEGHVVCHECDQPLCVNPDHLFVGTQTENVADCVSKGRTQRFNAMKTHCPHGHPYDDQNTHWRPDNARSCRACARERANARRAANPEKFRAAERRRYWANKESANV